MFEKLRKHKLLKIAGYVIIILFIVSLFNNFFLYVSLSDGSINPLKTNMITSTITDIIALILFFGFLKLGKLTKNKYVIIGSWLLLIDFLLGFIIFDISKLSGSNIIYISLYEIHHLTPVFITLIPGALASILVGMGLYRVMNIRFTKVTGLLEIFLGISFLLSLIFFFLPQEVLNVMIKWSLNPISLILGFVFSLVYTYFVSSMFFHASKKFET